jgi:excisionase family DNA binding protein
MRSSTLAKTPGDRAKTVEDTKAKTSAKRRGARFCGVGDVVEETGLSRRTVFRMLDNNEIPSTKVGARRLIPRRALDDWMDSLEAEACEGSLFRPAGKAVR